MEGRENLIDISEYFNKQDELDSNNFGLVNYQMLKLQKKVE